MEAWVVCCAAARAPWTRPARYDDHRFRVLLSGVGPGHGTRAHGRVCGASARRRIVVHEGQNSASRWPWGWPVPAHRANTGRLGAGLRSRPGRGAAPAAATRSRWRRSVSNSAEREAADLRARGDVDCTRSHPAQALRRHRGGQTEQQHRDSRLSRRTSMRLRRVRAQRCQADAGQRHHHQRRQGRSSPRRRARRSAGASADDVTQRGGRSESGNQGCAGAYRLAHRHVATRS